MDNPPGALLYDKLRITPHHHPLRTSGSVFANAPTFFYRMPRCSRRPSATASRRPSRKKRLVFVGAVVRKLNGWLPNRVILGAVSGRGGEPGARQTNEIVLEMPIGLPPCISSHNRLNSRLPVTLWRRDSDMANGHKRVVSGVFLEAKQ